MFSCLALIYIVKQQREKYGHLTLLFFVQYGQEQEYTTCPYKIRTYGNSNSRDTGIDPRQDLCVFLPLATGVNRTT